MNELIHNGEIGEALVQYCRKYDIPIAHIFEILEDQKVLPMLRGKATEYNATAALTDILNRVEWQVNKLNPNPQPGYPDEDIEIIHRRTKISIVVETKNAVRGSMKTGVRCRLVKVPHFHVKCHRSRSNLKMAATTNDRYSANSWDVLISNPFNAIVKGGTTGQGFEVVDHDDIRDVLLKYYGISTMEDLCLAAAKDWRFALPSDIAENGFIPRTPCVLLKGDPHWRPLTALDKELEAIVRRKARDRS